MPSYKNEEKIFTAGRGRDQRLEPHFGGIGEPQLVSLPGSPYRATLAALWENWDRRAKRRRHIAWHRLHNLGDDGSSVTETCSKNVTAWSQPNISRYHIKQHCSIIMVFSSCMGHIECQWKPSPSQEYAVAEVKRGRTTESTDCGCAQPPLNPIRCTICPPGWSRSSVDPRSTPEITLHHMAFSSW